jgi:hypothetical protein
MMNLGAAGVLLTDVALTDAILLLGVFAGVFGFLWGYG